MARSPSARTLVLRLVVVNNLVISIFNIAVGRVAGRGAVRARGLSLGVSVRYFGELVSDFLELLAGCLDGLDIGAFKCLTSLSNGLLGSLLPKTG